MKKFLLFLCALLLLVLIVLAIWIPNLNNYKVSGELSLSLFDKPVEIHRDQYGIPYIEAQTELDAFRAQGFVMAQDRIFQVEFYKALIGGRLSSLLGSATIDMDIQMRVLDFYGMADNHVPILNNKTMQILGAYADGYNAYLDCCSDEFPIELKLLGMQPSKLTPRDIVAVTHYIGYTQARNMSDEILSLNLSAYNLGLENIFPLNNNPDRLASLNFDTVQTLMGHSEIKTIEDLNAPQLHVDPIKLGSNNWAVNAQRSKSGQTIVANDPHLDARLLPGIFFPIGIFCPTFKAVGAALPGLPGIMVGRNEYVAYGVTNAYGDTQDLFIEQLIDDSHYVFLGDTLKLEERLESIKVKDGDNIDIRIRKTKNGPVISDFDVFGIKTKDVVSLRWSQSQPQSKTLGAINLIKSTDVATLREHLYDMDNMYFNVVFGDKSGKIAHQTTGLVPIRNNRKGRHAQTSVNEDPWIGFIPKDEMPHDINPAKGWVGTANHDNRPDDYPYYYSSHFSEDFRYSRIKELLDNDEVFDANQMWNYIMDCKNMQAEKLTPIILQALKADDNFSEWVDILSNWDFQDKANQVAPTLFHVLYDVLIEQLLNDELPDALEEDFWTSPYYWPQRLHQMILDGHEFIDDKDTPTKETITDQIVKAAKHADAFLIEKLGNDRTTWTWGQLHTIQFTSPIRREGFGANWLGTEVMPKNGSNQSLNRGGYVKGELGDYSTGWFSTFRMVADLNDNEKIMAVNSGGNAARVLHPYYKSQIEKWSNEEWIPYWFDMDKVRAHAEHTLVIE